VKTKLAYLALTELRVSFIFISEVKHLEARFFTDSCVQVNGSLQKYLELSHGEGFGSQQAVRTQPLDFHHGEELYLSGAGEDLEHGKNGRQVLFEFYPGHAELLAQTQKIILINKQRCHVCPLPLHLVFPCRI